MSIEKISLAEKGVQYIYKNDENMQKLIAWIGPFKVNYRDDYFASLVHSIVAQLISKQAADAVYGRLVTITNGVTPEKVMACEFDTLKSAGLTARKTEYIRLLAEEVLTGALDFETLKQESNQAVIKRLTALKGIGQWTAEVFLILSFRREDVVATGDVALQRAAAWLYGAEKSKRKDTLIARAANWAPYRSMGCLYLWEIIHLKLIENYDMLDQVIATQS